MSTPKNARAALGTSAADVYTAPAGGAKVTMIQVANVDGTNAVNVTVQWTDASAGAAITRLCYQAEVKAKDSIAVQAGGLILESGDKIQALASAAGDAEITVCVLEG
ncbi:hypothetical protein [Azospirillum sp. ST 5-10]|uniref:hypothetical protein n=1 Tax=unclassified Azospirillum TaxID=2630922 RepID=UPI003F49DC4B